MGSLLLALNGGYLISSFMSKQKDNENQGDKSQKDESQNDKKRKNKKQENNDENKEVSNDDMKAIKNESHLADDESQDDENKEVSNANMKAIENGGSLVYDENKGVNSCVPEHEKILSLVKKIWDGNTRTNYWVSFWEDGSVSSSDSKDEENLKALIEFVKIFSKKIPDGNFYFKIILAGERGIGGQFLINTYFPIDDEHLIKDLKINRVKGSKKYVEYLIEEINRAKGRKIYDEHLIKEVYYCTKGIETYDRQLLEEIDRARKSKSYDRHLDEEAIRLNKSGPWYFFCDSDFIFKEHTLLVNIPGI